MLLVDVMVLQKKVVVSLLLGNWGGGMNNNTNILTYQTKNGQTKINITLEDETIWMTQKAIAELFQTTPQNVTLHIKDLLQSFERIVFTRCYKITKQEGSRIINRKIIHYHLDLVVNIALKSRKIDELNHFIEYLSEKAIPHKTLPIVPIKEREFGKLLIGSLSGFVEVIAQFQVGSYFVDFYLPKQKLIVEYDENHHNNKQKMELDRIRQEFIEGKINIYFIRVKEGEEIQGLNRILKYVFRGGETHG